MLKRTLAVSALFALALSFILVPVPKMTAQNIGYLGRFPSDSGNPVWGYGTKTDTSTATMAAAPGTLNSNYVYWAACYSTSASVSVAILKGGSTALAAVPCPASAGFGQPVYFYPPLRVGINAAFTMENSAGVSTAYFTSMVRVARFQ